MPIKVKNFTHTADKKKLVVNDMTHLSFRQPREYSFQFKEITNSADKPVSVLDVLNSSSECEKVSVQGKILDVKEPHVVASPKKHYKLLEAVIGDSTGTMPLDLWESNIEEIKQEDVFSLNEV